MPPPPPADATEKEPVTLERHDVQKDHGNKAHVEDNASTASATQHQQHQQHQQRSQCTDDRLKVENLRHFRLPKPLHDPFIGDTNELCLWEWTKLCVFGIILAPVRALLCALLLFLLNVYLTVCSWGYNIKFDGEDEIPAELLARTKPVVQVCARALIFFLGCYYIPRKGKAANPKVRLCACVCLSVCPCVFMSVCVYVCVSVFVCVSVCVCVSVAVRSPSPSPLFLLLSWFGASLSPSPFLPPPQKKPQITDPQTGNLCC